MNDPLIELQSQFAFQEDLLRELNEVVTQQQQQIDELHRELRVHREKLVEVIGQLPERADAGDDRPPHY